MKRLTLASVSQEIMHVISYFAFFGYPPSLEEIHMFLSKKISLSLLKKEIDQMTSKNRAKTIVKMTFEAQDKSVNRYAFKGKENFFEQYIKRKATTEAKLSAVSLYLRLLKLVPVISFVGLSGSLSMNNGKPADDIDLCIISVPGRMWTARFTASMLASILGIKRGFRDTQVRDKICLNLFFDQKELNIGSIKQTEYVGHELLQLKTLIDKNDVYSRFLYTNDWVFRLFPNAEKYIKRIINERKGNNVLPGLPSKENSRQFFLFNVIGDGIEYLLKQVQLIHMKKHRTTEHITDTQLWFFPQDFEKKLKKRLP